MANSTIPNLNAVTVPALTDLFGVRQSGDTRDKKLTASQLLSLGGDVSKVGTPVNNQIGVWTGDGTIEGVSELTYTGVDFILGFNTGRIKGSNTNAGAILNEASSLGNPTLVPNTADSQTGIGGTANNLGVIVRGVAGTRWQHSTAGGGEVRQFQDLTTGIVASTTQTQGNGLVNGAAFTEVTTVANPDDVITLHNTGAAEYWTTIINTGANRLQIFPPVGDAILPGIVNASITLDVNKSVTLYTLDGTNWIRLVDPAGGGGGDVTKVGTPVNNQIGVWTGDGTLEGDANFTWDGAHLLLPLLDDAATPTLAFGDGDSGFYESADDTIKVTVLGVAHFYWVSNQFRSETAFGPALVDEAVSGTNPTLCPKNSTLSTGIGSSSSDVLSLIANASERVRISSTINTFTGNWVSTTGSGPGVLDEGASSTNPTLVPNQADPDTGIGRDAVDSLALIAGGVGCMRVREIAAAPAVGFYTTTPIVQQTGVGVDAASIHAACVALGLFTA